MKARSEVQTIGMFFVNEPKFSSIAKVFVEGDEKLKAGALQKSAFIMWANSQDNPDSALHTSHLPKEIALHIAQKLYSAMNKNCFFTLENLDFDAPKEAKEEENYCGV